MNPVLLFSVSPVFFIVQVLDSCSQVNHAVHGLFQSFSAPSLLAFGKNPIGSLANKKALCNVLEQAKLARSQPTDKFWQTTRL